MNKTRGEKRRKVKIKIKFEKRDCWMGVFWNQTWAENKLYVCLIPCFPIIFTWNRSFWLDGKRDN